MLRGVVLLNVGRKRRDVIRNQGDVLAADREGQQRVEDRPELGHEVLNVRIEVAVVLR